MIIVSAVSVAPVHWTRLGLSDPLADLHDWPPLRGLLKEKGLLDRPNTFIAGVRWHEAGRIDYALGGSVPVTCLCEDARGYGVLQPLAAHLGQNAIVLLHSEVASRFEPMLQSRFARLERLDNIVMLRDDDVAVTLAVFAGTSLH